MIPIRAASERDVDALLDYVASLRAERVSRRYSAPDPSPGRRSRRVSV
jgi:hypothetical protein